MEASFKSLNYFRTADSITLYWTCAIKDVPSNGSILYEIVLQNGNKYNKVAELKDACKYSITGLTKGTEYIITLSALGGNTLLCAQDIKVATLNQGSVKVTGKTNNSIALTWSEPSDGSIKTALGKYVVRYTEADNLDDTWHELKMGVKTSSFTFTGLKAGTKYNFCVFAYDESNNLVCQYPAVNGYLTESTLAQGTISRVPTAIAIEVKQGAKVLSGTDTISMELSYSLVQRDANGNVRARKSETWTHKWSNSSTKNDTIILPDGWGLEDNKFHVVIKSRRAASAGLNKWRVCSEGDVSPVNGRLSLRLTGSYYDYNVKFVQAD